MKVINDARKKILSSKKRLLIVVNHQGDIFIFFSKVTKVKNPTNISDWKVVEHIMVFKEFGKLDKLDFYKHNSDMMCAS